MPTLHVVIPFFEEAGTLEACLRRVADAPLPTGWRSSITLVDDGSSPAAAAEAKAIAERTGIRFLQHERNRGKGAALRTGFGDALTRAADDDIVIVQDADLEYEPSDFAALLEPILTGRADAVFGDRWGHLVADARQGSPHESARPHSAPLYRRLHRSLNRMLTGMSNSLSGLAVRDMECCYKVFRVPTLRAVLPWLSEDRFGIEPQIAATLGRMGVRLAEVPVRYAPRTFAEGKKIRAKDGVRALWVMLRERFRSAPPDSSAAAPQATPPRSRP